MDNFLGIEYSDTNRSLSPAEAITLAAIKFRVRKFGRTFSMRSASVLLTHIPCKISLPTLRRCLETLETKRLIRIKSSSREYQITLTEGTEWQSGLSDLFTNNPQNNQHDQNDQVNYQHDQNDHVKSDQHDQNDQDNMIKMIKSLDQNDQVNMIKMIKTPDQNDQVDPRKTLSPQGFSGPLEIYRENNKEKNKKKCVEKRARANTHTGEVQFPKSPPDPKPAEASKVSSPVQLPSVEYVRDCFCELNSSINIQVAEEQAVQFRNYYQLHPGKHPRTSEPGAWRGLIENWFLRDMDKAFERNTPRKVETPVRPQGSYEDRLYLQEMQEYIAETGDFQITLEEYKRTHTLKNKASLAVYESLKKQETKKARGATLLGQ